MKGVSILFFGSKSAYVSLADQLDKGMRLVFLPLSTAYNHYEYPTTKTVVILRNNPAAKSKLEELRQRHPRLPILVLADNPAQDDLLNAIRLNVKNLLILPLSEGQLAEAIREAYASSQKSRKTKGVHVLPTLARLWVAVKKLMPHPTQPLDPPANVLAISPFLRLVKESMSWDKKTSNLQLNFFGELKIVLWDKKVPKVKGNKNSSLLSYLLYHHQKPINREILMEKFWGDSSPSSARNSLNVAIYAIRKHFQRYALNQEIIILENNCYSINPTLDIYTDVEQFRQLCKKGRATELSQGFESALVIYQKALSLYQGDFLENMRFEDWCEPERDNLKETFLFILNRLSLHFFKQDEYDACISICKRMLEKDQCLEDAHRLLMRSYYQIGSRDRAKKQYLKCAKILQEEFNMSPSLQTQDLYKEIGEGKMVL